MTVEQRAPRAIPLKNASRSLNALSAASVQSDHAAVSATLKRRSPFLKSVGMSRKKGERRKSSKIVLKGAGNAAHRCSIAAGTSSGRSANGTRRGATKRMIRLHSCFASAASFWVSPGLASRVIAAIRSSVTRGDSAVTRLKAAFTRLFASSVRETAEGSRSESLSSTPFFSSD